MTPAIPPTLTTRALNRALLARQHLLERAPMAAADMVEHLVGMQAQNPTDPYIALWSRLVDFDPEELSELVRGREAVRLPFLRGTLHLATTRDALALRPVLRPVLERGFWSASQFGGRLRDIDVRPLLAAGRAFVEEQPRTVAELSAHLGGLWPERDAAAMAMAVRQLVPMVQPPPRGLWNRRGLARWTTLEAWTGRPLADTPDVDALFLRYLAAFGPASTADLRTWSWMTGLREVIARLRPRLARFRDEAGRELLDLPDAPRPTADTPAPARFLPEYDNLALSHADRSRIASTSVGVRLTGFVGTFLLDGFIAGQWRVTREPDAATLILDPFAVLSEADLAALETEGRALLAFLGPEVSERRIVQGIAWQPPSARRGRP